MSWRDLEKKYAPDASQILTQKATKKKSTKKKAPAKKKKPAKKKATKKKATKKKGAPHLRHRLSPRRRDRFTPCGQTNTPAHAHSRPEEEGDQEEGDQEEGYAHHRHSPQ